MSLPKPYYQDGNVAIYHGDCLGILQGFPDETVQCCVTSPPYFGLRDYGEDGQIGLEPTPDAYVEKIVAVFREVRRVLKQDGTLWLNLGDSYCSSPPGNKTIGVSGKSGLNGVNGSSGKYRNTLELGHATKRDTTRIEGLKPKDLIGIPWRVAFALQQPYYSGKIKNIEDRIWLAAMIDGEGCMFIHKRKAGQNNGQGYQRQNDSYGAGLEVANTHRAIVERCMEITGAGSLCTVERESKLKNRNIPLHRWNLRSNQCREIIREIYPHLVGKQHEARLLLGCPSSGPEAEAAHAGLILLHNGKITNVDFPAPASMFEQGFYLRQDIIWSKNNPMPESVRDRPTKAHEYLFLLSKSQKYYYDAEAIKEPATHESLSRYDRGRSDTHKWADGGPGNQSIAKSFAHMKEKKDKQRGHGRRHDGFNDRWDQMSKDEQCSMGRNKRSVWTVATQPYPEAHFATFPQKLIEPCILAGSKPGDVVIDPFSGSGTTPFVSKKLNRQAIAIELSEAYIQLQMKRLAQEVLDL